MRKGEPFDLLSAEGVECASSPHRKSSCGGRGGTGPLEMDSGVCQIGHDLGYTQDPIFKEQQERQSEHHIAWYPEAG